MSGLRLDFASLTPRLNRYGRRATAQFVCSVQTLPSQ